MGPVFLHAIYLINLGTPDAAHLERGIQSLINYMELAADIGAQGVIFHPGSHKRAGYEAMLSQTVDTIKKVLDASPEGPDLATGPGIQAMIAEFAETIGSFKPLAETLMPFAAGGQPLL